MTQVMHGIYLAPPDGLHWYFNLWGRARYLNRMRIPAGAPVPVRRRPQALISKNTLWSLDFEPTLRCCTN
jgi:hypothetical protein